MERTYPFVILNLLLNFFLRQVMKLFHSEVQQNNFSAEINLPKDFTAEDLALLKTLFMTIEKEIDSIPLISNGDKKSQTFTGSHIFRILNKAEVG